MTASVELVVSHRTVTQYSARVEVAYHCAHLSPRQDERQRVGEIQLTIDPPPSRCTNTLDSFGNVRTEFALYVPHEMLSVEVQSRVSIVPRPQPLEPSASVPWESVESSLRYALDTTFRPASEFIFGSPYVPLVPELRAYAQPSFTPGRRYLAGAIALMEQIHRDFTYEPGVTEVGTPLMEAFRLRRGVCQDFAHLMLGMLRSLGLPARYVSGYLQTQPPPGRSRLLGADASHAWISIWCPSLGWVDLDPTNAAVPDASHVTVAVGRDFGDVVPLRGVIQGGASHTLEVSVDVTPAIERAA